MGEHELQEALRSKVQERVRALWQAAEDAVAAERASNDAQQAALNAAAERQQAAAAAVVRRKVLAAAELAARQQQLAAESLLQQRLHALALRLLPALGSDRRRLWQALAAELPPADWQTIRVHPDDRHAAAQLFPGAAVVDEKAMAGGLIAGTSAGRIVVDNSLAGRLERAWPGMLVPLFAAINEEVARDAAGSAATD